MTVVQFKKKPIRSLSEHSLLRYFTFIALYFSQGIPDGITLFAIPAWMAMNGKSTAEIAGYSAIVLIPFSLKILFAPMIERYTYLPMGRRRPWLLLGQFGILCGLISLSFIPNPLENISSITIAVVCLHVFIIFQDIATDSLVIDIVPLDQQGKANSYMWGSKTVGTSISLAVGSWLINTHGLSFAVLVMSTSVFLIMFIPLILRERKGEKLLPWSEGKTSPDAAFLAVDSWSKLFKSFLQVILLRNTLLLVTAVFIIMASIHFVRTLLPIFTIQELGWDNVFYSKVYSTSILIGGVFGMIVGSVVIHRYGIVHLIQVSLSLMILLVISAAFSMALWKNSTFISAFIALFCALSTLANIGVLALAMKLCWKRISAMQFTFCMTIFNAGLAFGAALLGNLRSHLEWQSLFFVVAIMIPIAMMLLMLINTKEHSKQVENLEQKYIDALHAEGKLLVQSDTI